MPQATHFFLCLHAADVHVCNRQITLQDWGEELFGALKKAGGTAYSNYAVGYNNVSVPEATKNGIAVGNTPGEHPILSIRDCLLDNSSKQALWQQWAIFYIAIYQHHSRTL